MLSVQFFFLNFVFFSSLFVSAFLRQLNYFTGIFQSLHQRPCCPDGALANPLSPFSLGTNFILVRLSTSLICHTFPPRVLLDDIICAFARIARFHFLANVSSPPFVVLNYLSHL